MRAPDGYTAAFYQNNGYGFSDDQATPISVVPPGAAAGILDALPPFYFAVTPGSATMAVLIKLKGVGCPSAASLLLRTSSIARDIPLDRATGTECLFIPPAGTLDLAPFLIYVAPLKLLIQFLLAGCLAWALVTLPSLWTRRKEIAGSREARIFGACFLFFFIWYLVIVSATWPGFIGEDGFPPLEQVTRLHFTSWFSILYPALVLGMQQITGSFASLGIFIAFFMAALIATIVVAVSRFRISPALLLFTLAFFLLSPAVLTYLSFVTRDVISGLTNCALLACTFFVALGLHYRRKNISRNQLTGVMALGFISAAIRLENIGLVAACGGLLYYYASTSRATLRRRFAGFLVIIVAWQMILTPLVTGEKADLRNGYAINPLLNPMGGMVHDDYVTDTPDEDMRAIGSVVDPAIFRDHWHIYGLSYFKWPTTATHEQLDDFRAVTLKSIIHNPELYLGRRAELFAAILGCPHTWFFTDYSRGGRIGDLKNYRVYRDHPSSFYDLVSDYVTGPIVSWQNGDSLWCYAWSAWAQFLILLAVFANRCRLPITGLTAGCLLVRLALLFFLAPAAHFFYVFDLVLFGSFLPLLASVEWTMKRHSRKTTLR